MGWIGVDFDGVLAVRIAGQGPGWVNPSHQWSQGLKGGFVMGMTSEYLQPARMTGSKRG